MPVEFDPHMIDQRSGEFKTFMKTEAFGRMENLHQFTVDEFKRRGVAPFHRICEGGSWYGPFTQYWLQIGEQVLSYDIDYAKVSAAKDRPELQTALAQNRLQYIQAKAQQAPIARNSLGLYVAYEMLGAGFRGDGRDMLDMFSEMTQTVQPGGFGAFTVRSRTMDLSLARVYPVHTFDTDEIIIHRRTITEMMKALGGGHIDWYGQIITALGGPPDFGVTISRDSTFTGHAAWQPNAYEVRPIADITKESPMYWIGIWQKPLA